MAKDIRIGIVGCGQIATVEHAPALSRLPGVRLAAFCDIVKSKREHFRDTFSPEAAVFSSFPALLKTDLDAVVVSVPNYLHCRITVAALKAGLHVLCEKPMAGNLADAAKIVAAARRAHRIVHVNQSLRYSRFHNAIADLIRKGSIGKPIHIRCIRGHGTTPDKGWSPGAKWFVSRKAQGGVIFDIGVHMADMLQWWFGRVDEISAVVNTRTPGIDVPDHVASVFRFSNGATGILELSWAMPTGAGLVEIYGTKGSIRAGFSEKPIELTTLADGKTTTSYPDLTPSHPTSQEAFVAAIRRTGRTLSPAELGFDAVALCEAIARAGATGKAVKVRHCAKQK